MEPTSKKTLVIGSSLCALLSLCFVTYQKSQKIAELERANTPQALYEKRVNEMISLRQNVIENCQQEMEHLTAQGFGPKRRRVKKLQDRMDNEVAVVAQLQNELNQPYRNGAHESLEQLIDTQQDVEQTSEEDEQDDASEDRE